MRKASEQIWISQVDVSKVGLEEVCLKIKKPSKHASCRKLKCTEWALLMPSSWTIFYSESNIVMQVFKNTCIILIPLKAKRICVPNIHKPQNQDFVQV